MQIVAGLGNPGAKYANNRHNVGFMAADAIARRHSFSPWSKKFQAEVCSGDIGGRKVLLIKPQTFMNLSGQAVGEAMRFYKLGPEAVTVLYDEIDLAPGKLRIKVGGGAGGHNGIRSLDQHLGQNYKRIRIGVGHPGVRDLVHGHVLGDFAKADAAWLQPLLDAIADNAELLVKGDDSGLMNKVALAVAPAAGEATERPARPPANASAKSGKAAAPEKPSADDGPMSILKRLLNRK